MAKQRISYVDLDKMDLAMRAKLDRCRREGTPRPESSAVRAHVPGAFWAFANSWRDIFHTGVCDHAIKELCRLYVSRSVTCQYTEFFLASEILMGVIFCPPMRGRKWSSHSSAAEEPDVEVDAIETASPGKASSPTPASPRGKPTTAACISG